MDKKASKFAPLAVILAGALWGIISLFVRSLYDAGLDALQISALRLCVAAASLVLVLLLFRRSLLRIRLRDLWMFVCTGVVSVVLFNTLYFYTTVNSQASVAVVLLYTSPAFVILLSALCFREKITGRKLLALGMTVGGCVLVSGMLGGGYALTPKLLLTGLGSGLFYALYTIFARLALNKYDSMTVTVYTFLMGALGALPLGKLGQSLSVLAAAPTLWVSAVCIGIVSTVLPYALYTWGLQRMDSGRASLLVAVEPLVGALVGILVFHEACGFWKILGVGLILGAVCVLSGREKAEN